MSMKEQAEMVLNSKAFKTVHEDLREEYLGYVLSAPIGSDELDLARAKYDALADVYGELEARMRSFD